MEFDFGNKKNIFNERIKESRNVTRNDLAQLSQEMFSKISIQFFNQNVAIYSSACSTKQDS